MGALGPVASAIVMSYLLSATFVTPLLIVCWTFGLRLSWSTVLTATGWGAVMIVAAAIVVAAVG